jgi:hypothetical protein
MEPVLKGFQHYGGVKKLYLLHSANDPEFKFRDLAEEVRRRLRATGFEHTELRQIDPFDMENIINNIVEIAENDHSHLYLNITGGTNLMAGAACAASFFVGASAYYVLGRKGTNESRVIELPVPHIPYNRVLQKSQLAVLACIRDIGNFATSVAIRDRMGFSPQKLSYHIKELEKKALVVTSRGRMVTSGKHKQVDRRKISVSLTNAGRLVLTWSPSS